MSYQFDGTTGSKYLTAASFPAASQPITLACWFNWVSDNGSLIAVGNTSTSHRFNVTINGATSKLQAFVGTPTAVGLLIESSTVSANTWTHMCAVFTSSSLVDLYHNGVNVGTSTTSTTATNADTVQIGARYNSSWGLFLNGKVAEAGVWNAALTIDEIVSLSKGVASNNVRPQSLQFYAPLIRDLIDEARGLTII